MYPRRRRMVRQALRLGLVVTIVVLAMSACGGVEKQQESRPRPLPEDPKALRPGEYRSEEFKPSFSFRVGKGWTIDTPSPEAPDSLPIGRGEESGQLAFANVQQVYNPEVYNKPGVEPYKAGQKVEAPKNLVGWYQHHPYLQATKPEPISVGGVKGVQFDAVLPRSRPVNHKGVCGGTGCLDIFKLSTGGSSELFGFYRDYEKKEHYIILDDVKGVPVVINYNDEKDVYDEFVPVAEKVLKSVEWTDD
jgi:hypothetical protein